MGKPRTSPLSGAESEWEGEKQADRQEAGERRRKRERESLAHISFAFFGDLFVAVFFSLSLRSDFQRASYPTTVLCVFLGGYGGYGRCNRVHVKAIPRAGKDGTPSGLLRARIGPLVAVTMMRMEPVWTSG